MVPSFSVASHFLPLSLVRLLQSLYCQFKWDSILCSNIPETHGKLSQAPVCWGAGKASLLQGCVYPNAPRGAGIQMHIQRCLFISGMLGMLSLTYRAPAILLNILGPIFDLF